jgi:hypothetical protein
MQALLEYGHGSAQLQDDPQEGVTALERGAAMARERADAGAELDALHGLFRAHLLQARHDAAWSVAQRFEAAASLQADAAAGLVAHRLLGMAAHLCGRPAAAEQHAHQALQAGARGVGRLHGHPAQVDHCTASRVLQARLLWWRGLPDQALQAANTALEAAANAQHPPSQAYALALAACPVALWRGDRTLARRRVDELEACAQGHGLAAWQGWAPWYRVAMERLGLAAGPCAMPLNAPWPAQEELLATMQVDLAQGGLFERESPWCAPELRRLTGERLAMRGREGDFAQAEVVLRHALVQAQQEGAFAWVLRCATSLARLLSPTQPMQARALLADTLAHCTEGAGTRDLREAQAALRRIEAAAGAVRAPAC